MGPSCSTHNPWSVDPDPRGVGRLGAEPASNHDLRTPRRQRAGGGPVTEAPGCATKNPADSLPRGPVSTALTSTIQPPKHPAEIVGILRFVLGVQRRCACDVSTMDTSDLPALFPPRIAVFRTTSLPRTPVRTSVSEVMTLKCLRSEETAQCPKPSIPRHKARPRRRRQVGSGRWARGDRGPAGMVRSVPVAPGGCGLER